MLTTFTKSGTFTSSMNNAETVNIQGPFDPEALDILRAIPGLAAFAEPLSDHGLTDGVVRFAGVHAQVTIESKHRVNAAAAWEVVRRASQDARSPMLLVASETTADARKILVDHGIAFVDGHGNADIHLPGLFFHVRDHSRGVKQKPTPPRLSGRAGVAVQSLLLNLKRTWKVQDLALEAHISSAFAHRIFVRMENEHIVASEGHGPHRVRRVTAPAALLDLWAEEQHVRLHPMRVYRLAQSTYRLIQDIGAALDDAGIEYALTGAAAARLTAPYVSSIPIVELWVDASWPIEQLCTVASAEAVEDGHNIVFLQSKDNGALVFREKINGIWVTNRFQLYVDLRRDPRRGAEQAEHLRAEVIKF